MYHLPLISNDRIVRIDVYLISKQLADSLSRDEGRVITVDTIGWVKSTEEQ